MPLKLVTGPANAGKAGEVLGGYRARLDDEPILVVPAFRDVEHAQRELAGHGAVFGTRVMRFARLFEMVADRCRAEVRGARRVSAVQRQLLIDHAIRSTRLDTLATSAARPGFARAAGRFFAELGRSMVEPQRLRHALGVWAGEGPGRAYADQVSALYATYRRTLEGAGLVDDPLFAWRALDALRAEPDRFGRTPVFIYGFDDFTPLELELVELLATVAGTEVVVSLPYEAGRTAFDAVLPTYERLSAVATERVELPASADHYDPNARTPLHHLERCLFEPVRDRVAPDAAVRLLSAGGDRAEIELVGAEVLELLRTGMAAGQVAVVFRETDRCASLIDQVFTAYGIPFSLARSLPLKHTGLGAGALALLRCACGTGSADDLLTYLRTPGKLDRPELADWLESDVRRAGIRRAEEARELWEAKRWTLDEIDRLSRASSTAAVAAQLSAEVERLFVRPYERRARVFSEPESEDPRARETLGAALDDVAGLAAADSATVPDRRALHDLLAELPVRVGADPAPDRVQVARPEAIRARRFSAVFVCGLQEGEFPRPARPEPFLSDDERRAVARASGLVLPLREDRAARERYLFYACVSRAERLLALSWRETDEEGAPQVRSFLVDDVRDALDADQLDRAHRTRPLSAVAWDVDHAPTAAEWERARALAGPRSSPPQPDRLEGEEVLAELRARDRLSAGALESYADCPVKWLVERWLRPDALEPDPEPMVRGRYAHAVLELTYRRLRERTGSRRVTPGNLADAEALLLEALRDRQSEFQISPQATRVRTAVRRLEFDLLRHLRAEAEAGGSFEPAELELEFGAEDSLQPAVGIADGLSVRGRIDRVDTSDGYALVRDYKTGKTAHPVAAWERDRRLQVALYMIAARELLGAELAGGVYVPLAGKDRRPRGIVLDSARDKLGGDFVQNDVQPRDEIERQLDLARRRAVELAGRMRSGDVRPCPKTCAWNDSGCTYPSICRVER